MNKKEILPCLTKEEWDYFRKNNTDFFRKYNLIWKVSLYKRIGMSIQKLAVDKLMRQKKKDEAVNHHFKACKYYPEIINRHIFRKEVGLI